MDNKTSTSKQSFITDHFLLENDVSQKLYHEFAADLPIIDYHCHLPPNEIANNRQFETLTQLWIDGDHYKWRAMRTFGIEEHYITGTASDEEKFVAWAKTVPYTLRNPLFHWTHLELLRYFSIDECLTEKNALDIYNECNQKLQTDAFRCQGLLQQMNVEVVCTTEDPLDTLDHHQNYRNSKTSVTMSTAFRPDPAVMILEDSYLEYIDDLSKVSGVSIHSLDDLLDALVQRINFFHTHGCRLSDLGMNYLPYQECTEQEAKRVFTQRVKGGAISDIEAEQFQTFVLQFLCKEYYKRGWVQQFHLGAMRNNNTRKTQELGANTGWDSIGDYDQGRSLSSFLNALAADSSLPKTILYNLNPADNELFASMIGNFNDGTVKGKVQYGSGWWFLDQKDGITKQLNALSNMSLVSTFVGMLTDSRSFLSFPRHEYFRRILCNLFGTEIQKGELPEDYDLVGKIIQDICYYNAKNYFDFSN